MLKYVQVAATLYEAGFSVYLYDHRGQGLSDRDPILGPTEQQVAFVGSYDEYVSDLLMLIRTVVPEQHRPVHLLVSSGAPAQPGMQTFTSQGLLHSTTH